MTHSPNLSRATPPEARPTTPGASSRVGGFSKLRVLVACEYSGRVRDAFLARGHDAMSCDLLPTDSPGPHYQGDALDLLGQPWDLIVAHPPCTYISRAGARWMYPKAGSICEERLRLALSAKSLFMKILAADCQRICVENPTPLKVVGLPRHSQAIQPYQFGHPYSKRTLLWLKGLPKLRPTNVTSDFQPFLRSNTGKGARMGQASSKGVAKDWKEASTTFEGIADAMAAQWGGVACSARLETAE